MQQTDNDAPVYPLISHCSFNPSTSLGYLSDFWHTLCSFSISCCLESTEISTGLSKLFWMWKLSPGFHETIFCGWLKFKRCLHVLGGWEGCLLYPSQCHIQVHSEVCSETQADWRDFTRGRPNCHLSKKFCVKWLFQILSGIACECFTVVLHCILAMSN